MRRVLLWTGVALLCAFPVGLILTVWGMLRAFKTVAQTDAPVPPGMLGNEISAALVASGMGLALSVVGLVLVIASRVVDGDEEEPD